MTNIDVNFYMLLFEHVDICLFEIFIISDLHRLDGT
jgi:hypothetical protein